MELLVVLAWSAGTCCVWWCGGERREREYDISLNDFDVDLPTPLPWSCLTTTLTLDAHTLTLYHHHSHKHSPSMPLVDTHCHIHRGDGGVETPQAEQGGGEDLRERETPPSLGGGGGDAAYDAAFSNAAEPERNDVVLYCPMAVDEGDWAKLKALQEQEQQQQGAGQVLAVGLGIHPWKAHEVSEGWETRLREALIQMPSLLVGEIGLDKAREADKTGWETQLRVFEEQMELAAELRRPVSMHCVRAYGTIYDWLKQRPMAAACPPSLAFHSYTGSPEMASAFLALPHLKESIFFGFSASVCLQSPAAETKLCNVLRVLPRESFLLESDLDDRNAVPAAMTRVCEVVSRAVGMERQALAEMTTRNAERFLRRTLI